jgi:hypothetical protein
MTSSSALASASITITITITTATLLASLLLPSVALAQQPAAPATGEPPPIEARAQEQATITRQAQQAYAQTHQDELRREAARQVENERRAAWDQRGRDSVAPAIITRPPSLILSFPGRFGALFQSGDELQLGISTELDVRVRKWWGLSAGLGIDSFRNTGDVYVPASRLGAVATEASGFLAIPASNSTRYIAATTVVFRVGHQLLFPIGQPTLPTVYLGLFAGFGGKIAVAPIDGGKGYIALDFEARVGYRFGLGSGEDSAIKGSYVDLLAGPAVGF